MTTAHNKERLLKAASLILEEITRRPSTLHQLSDRFGISVFTVRRRLDDLMAAGQVHYVEVSTKGGVGKGYVWHAGPSSGLQIGQPLQALQQVDAHGQRDPLVAALFGPACRETA